MNVEFEAHFSDKQKVVSLVSEKAEMHITEYIIKDYQ